MTDSNMHKDAFLLDLVNYDSELQVDPAELLNTFKMYTDQNVETLVRDNRQLERALPFLVIAGRFASKYGSDLSGVKATVESEIPIGKGLASSAACSTSFTVALARYLRLDISDAELIDIARDGERVVHKNHNAGAIDASTSYYGGYVSFDKKNGPRSEQIKVFPQILLVDTGPKKPTKETVGHVAELYNNDPARLQSIFEEIGRCSREGIARLKEGDVEGTGRLMFENHELLKEIGVSNENLDFVVDEALKNGLPGAKLSGGGGGGIAIVLIKDGIPGQFERVLAGKGFSIYDAEISSNGTKELFSIEKAKQKQHQ